MNDLQIREVQIEDARGMARVHAAGWKIAYRGTFPDDILDALSEESGTPHFSKRIEDHLATRSVAPYFVALLGGTVVGYAHAIVPPQKFQEKFDSEIKALYVDPAVHRQGVGRKLVSAAAHRLADRNFSSMLIQTTQQNPFRTFYEKLGGRVVEGAGTITVGECEVPLVAFGWGEIRYLF